MATSKKLRPFLVPFRNKARGDRYAKLCTYTQGQVYRRVVYLDGWVFACFGPGDPGWERYWIAWQDAIKGLCRGLYWLANPDRQKTLQSANQPYLTD